MIKREFQKHPYLVVEYKNRTIELDEDLCELVPLMWSLGILTLYSCQGDKKYKDETVWSNRRLRAYIMMSNTEESLEFIQKLLVTFPVFQPKKKVSWEIEFDKHRVQGSRICIRFPNSDIPKLIEWINENY